MPNSGVTQSIESLVGPCSEVISIAGFLSSDSHDKLQHAIVESENAWDGLSDQEKQVIEGECSLSDLRECLEKTWDNPTLSTYLLKEHESSMNALYAANPKNKRQTKKPYLPDPEILPGEVIALQKELDGARLNCWKSDSASSLFVRTPRNADYNTLNAVRPSNTQTQVLNGERSAVLTISVYSKVPWGPSYVNRICQQAYLSWQTLRDIYDALPCIFKAGTPSTESHLGVQPGCAICIEGVLYSDSPPFAE
ncbi:hypothetical protein FA15DRAFT_598751 [Coprinopsis marcescibilis]|uniref:Uncharacterized protein n=1 Tax=Coprinopsis marcescibilis TaxID=230819 RepID=A0A5C3KMB0_COPMA|nr:hypothetical protein FA15DRAFT_598751 [Coprinopsis marcescibilis]